MACTHTFIGVGACHILIAFLDKLAKERRDPMDRYKKVCVLRFCLLLLLCLPYHASSLSKPPSPVIFIHGIASSAQAWLPITSFLLAEGWTFGGFPTFDAATGSVASVFPGDFYTLNFSDYDLPQFRSQNLSFTQQGAELSAIIQAVLAHSALWADSWDIHSFLRDWLVERLRYRCHV
jgi:hypothetical protein